VNVNFVYDDIALVMAWTCGRDIFGPNRLTAQLQSINRFVFATIEM